MLRFGNTQAVHVALIVAVLIVFLCKSYVPALTWPPPRAALSLFRRVPSVLITINIHDDVQSLSKQLENIRCLFQHPSFSIVLNVNDHMQKQLQNTEYVELCNPTSINKRRFHGSLLKGIVKNLQYAQKNVNFDYVLVMSSRTLFRRKCTLNDMLGIMQHHKVPAYSLCRWTFKRFYEYADDSPNVWWWSTFMNTIVGKKYAQLVGGAHEGLFFDATVCQHLFKLPDSLYEEPACIEEFVIQTLCANHNVPFTQLSQFEEFNSCFPLCKVQFPIEDNFCNTLSSI